MDWDDLRYVLAVSRTGSALRAAALLGVNQTTVLRRLDALETGIGEPLFNYDNLISAINLLTELLIEKLKKK